MADRQLTKEEIDANVTKAIAEAEKARAEGRKADAEAAMAEAKLEGERIDLGKKEYEDRERLAADKYNHTYRFTGAVGEASVKACIGQLTSWHRMDGDDPGPIKIIFQSPGGSVIEGMALFDFIQELRGAGHHITCLGSGYAASMAGILLQAGDERVMTAESWLLIHEGSFGVGGSVGEVEDTVEWVKKISDRILNIFATRSGASGCPRPLSKAQLKRRWHRKDWWLSSDEALEHGFIDRIASSLEV